MHAACETGFVDALDPEQLRQVNKCLEFLKPLETCATQVHKELRLDINLGKKHKTFGTADRVVLKNNKAYLVDFKFGRLSVVSAEQNLQAMSYTVGIFQRFPDVGEVTCYFLLPRRDEVTMHTFSRELLDQYVDTLAKLFDEVTVKAPPRTPCKACEYCAKLAKCPAVVRDITAAIKPEGLVLPKKADPASMSPEILDSFALPFARIIEAWCRQVKERTKSLLLEGVEFEHHKLGERAAKANINGTVNDAWTVLDDLLDLDEFMSACSLSVSQLKKAVRAKAPRGMKDDAETNLVVRLGTSGLITDEPEKQTYIQRK